MKEVLISIKPKWCWKIASGEKTIEVRKTAPKEVPFKAYIYCTSSDVHSALVVGDGDAKLIHCCNYKNAIPVGGAIGNGKVIGEFVCDKIYPIKAEYDDGGSAERRHKSIETFLPGKEHNELVFAMCLETDELFDYLGNGKWGYGWHISDLKIYDKPKELSEFYVISESGSDCCCGCVWQETPLDEMPCRTCTAERKYLYRPPQSWQYVEELK